MTDLEAYTEQIARDTATLAMDETFHVPSREFYEERIVAYRATARELLDDQTRDTNGRQ